MRRILVVRKADEFSRILKAHHYDVLNLPLIETKILNDLSDFEKKLAKIENYDGIFLTSAQGTRIFVEKLREKNIDFKGKVYVLGTRSYELSKNKSFEIVFDETANTAQEFLEKISPEALKNKRFLFIRGEKSLRVVPEFLSKLAEVEEAIVYETREISIDVGEIEKLRKSFAQNEMAAICFFSPSAAENFIKQFGAEVLHQTLIAAIGKTTAEFFEQQNLTVDFVSPKAAAKDFAVELSKYLGKN